MGFETSFLLYPLDSDWVRGIPTHYKTLQEMFDFFSVIPSTKRLHQAAKGVYHEIDEWWDESIERELRWLFDRKRFDVFLVNYTFFSKAFEFTPTTTTKVLDTHDVFTNRRETFEKHGVGPEFFYTTQDQEKIALDRADIVVGIKLSETEFFRSITKARAICVPYWDETARPEAVAQADRLEAPTFDRPLRVGFIGADNSVNVLNVQRFIQRFSRYMLLYNAPLEFRVAGNVCRRLSDSADWVRLLGRVEVIEDFYRDVDIVLTPLEFSTGIKIKVGEALSWNKPVISTQNGFDGFPAAHKMQNLPSMDAVCEALISIAFGETPLGELRDGAQKAAVGAARNCAEGFEQLGDLLRARLTRIVVYTDRAFWLRRTFVDEMLAQSIEFCARLDKVVVFYSGTETFQNDRVWAELELLHVNPDDAAGAFTLFGEFSIRGFLFFIEDVEHHAGMAAAAVNAGLPVWQFLFQEWDDCRFPQIGFSRRVEGETETTYVSPLRYLPPAANYDASTTAKPGRILVVVNEEQSEWDQIALGYVSSLAMEHSVGIETIAPARRAEFHVGMFGEMLRELRPTVFIGRPSLAWGFLRQALGLANLRWLQLSEEVVFPLFRYPNGLPSMERSIQSFFGSDTFPTICRHSADAGWDAMWNALSQTPAVKSGAEEMSKQVEQK
jgi:glycosyltransferase involved in cell wall biosynthesis